MQFTIYFLFSALSVGIYGHRQNSRTGNLAWVPLSKDSPDGYSTEYLFVNSEAADSSTDASWLTRSAENPVTLDPNPSWRPYEQKHYVPIRHTLKLTAKHDFLSKGVFDYFNRPSPMRTFIDSIFYSAEQYRKERERFVRVENRSSSAEDQLNNIVDKVIEQITENVNEIYNPELSSKTEDVMTNVPVSEAGINVESDDVLHRSGLLVQMAQEVTSQTENSPTETTDAGIDVTSEKFSKGNVESDNSIPFVTTCDTNVEISEEVTKVPEHIPEETKHFTKDWSRTRFPPVKTKTVVYTKIADSEKPYDVPVSQVLKPKLAETSEPAAYKEAVVSQVVEGTFLLAETIARETAQLVNRITMEVLRHNVDRPKFKTVDSGYKIAGAGVKYRLASAKYPVME